MKNDYNNILEIKKGNKEKEEFYKSKLKETAKKLGVENISDDVIDKIFNEALNTYQEASPIPFVFYMNGILKKENKKEYKFKEIELEVINLYLGNSINTFPSIEKIANSLNIPIIFTSNIIRNFDTLRETEEATVLKAFPNYKEQLEKRKEFYRSKLTLTNEDIKLLGMFLKSTKNKDLTFNSLAKKYNTNYKEIKRRLIRIFNLLKRPKNMELVTKEFGDINDKLTEKAIDLDLIIKPKLKEQPKKTHKRGINSHLTKNNIALIKNIERRFKEKLTEEEFIRLCEKDGIKNVQNQIASLYKKIEENKQLYDEALNISEDFLKFKLISTVRDRQIIEMLLKQDKENLTDQEISILLKYNDLKIFKGQRDRVLNKIYEEEDFGEEITKLYPDIIDTYQYQEFARNKRKAKLALECYNFSFILEQAISNYNTDDKIKEKALYLYKMIRNNEIYNFPKDLIATISIINERINNNLSIQKAILNAGYSSIERLIDDFYTKVIESKNKQIESMIPTIDEIEIMKALYTPNEQGYQTNVDIAKKYHCGKNKVSKIKLRILENIDNKDVLNSITDTWESFKEDVLIKDNFNSYNSVALKEDDLTNIKRNRNNERILEGLYNLNESIFGDYAKTRSIDVQLILALRLGFFNNHPFSSSEVAEIVKRDEEEIINLTKECLIACKDKLKQKVPSKIKL